MYPYPWDNSGISLDDDDEEYLFLVFGVQMQAEQHLSFHVSVFQTPTRNLWLRLQFKVSSSSLQA